MQKIKRKKKGTRAMKRSMFYQALMTQLFYLFANMFAGQQTAQDLAANLETVKESLGTLKTSMGTLQAKILSLKNELQVSTPSASESEDIKKPEVNAHKNPRFKKQETARELAARQTPEAVEKARLSRAEKLATLMSAQLTNLDSLAVAKDYTDALKQEHEAFGEQLEEFMSNKSAAVTETLCKRADELKAQFDKLGVLLVNKKWLEDEKVTQDNLISDNFSLEADIAASVSIFKQADAMRNSLKETLLQYDKNFNALVAFIPKIDTSERLVTFASYAGDLARKAQDLIQLATEFLTSDDHKQLEGLDTLWMLKKRSELLTVMSLTSVYICYKNQEEFRQLEELERIAVEDLKNLISACKRVKSSPEHREANVLKSLTEAFERVNASSCNEIKTKASEQGSQFHVLILADMIPVLESYLPKEAAESFDQHAARREKIKEMFGLYAQGKEAFLSNFVNDFTIEKIDKLEEVKSELLSVHKAITAGDLDDWKKKYNASSPKGEPKIAGRAELDKFFTLIDSLIDNKITLLEAEKLEVVVANKSIQSMTLQASERFLNQKVMLSEIDSNLRAAYKKMQQDIQGSQGAMHEKLQEVFEPWYNVSLSLDQFPFVSVPLSYLLPAGKGLFSVVTAMKNHLGISFTIFLIGLIFQAGGCGLLTDYLNWVRDYTTSFTNEKFKQDPVGTILFVIKNPELAQLLNKNFAQLYDIWQSPVTQAIVSVVTSKITDVATGVGNAGLVGAAALWNAGLGKSVLMSAFGLGKTVIFGTAATMASPAAAASLAALGLVSAGVWAFSYYAAVGASSLVTPETLTFTYNLFNATLGGGWNMTPITLPMPLP
jgi:hypothetical protein